MSKEILLITNYFPPEKGAAANRMQSVAEGLGKAGYAVKVVCPLPNYPNGKIFEGYSGKLSVKENSSFGKIARLWVWPSNSTNKLVRLLSMISFSFSLVLFFYSVKLQKRYLFNILPFLLATQRFVWGDYFQKK